MPTSVSLGDHFEVLVKGLVENGRYNNASEVVRDGLRMVEARERRLATLDAALARSQADYEAGRVSPISDVRAELRARYTKMSAERGVG